MSRTQHKFRAVMPLVGIETGKTPTGIKLGDIQGDVFPSFSKDFAEYKFFTIGHADDFRAGLTKLIHDRRITTAEDLTKAIRKIGEVHAKFANEPLEVKAQNRVKIPQFNIALSSKGMSYLGYHPEYVCDEFFEKGMGVHAVPFLGDHPVPAGEGKEVDWDPQFKEIIHGVLLMAADCKGTLEELRHNVNAALGDSINNVVIIDGAARPKENRGHEHFGFKDGISQPALRGLADPLPGQLQCDPGVILFGHAGDPKLAQRPGWTKNGSLMAFRKLRQYVPEFNKFLKDHPAPEATWKYSGVELTKQEQIDLTGARMVGRWKSGTPIDITEFQDVPSIGANKFRNNNFDYSALEPQDAELGIPGQYRCPFAAHSRKMAPRRGTTVDLGDTHLDQDRVLENSMIVRTAIPYGPEVLDGETETKKDRGLAFVCYQSSLKNGFGLLQNRWANNTNFPPQAAAISKLPVPGYDPLIGSNEGNDRHMSGLFAKDLKITVDMPEDFVVARGGEYFFVPSLSTLQTIGEKGDLPAPSDGD